MPFSTRSNAGIWFWLDGSLYLNQSGYEIVAVGWVDVADGGSAPAQFNLSRSAIDFEENSSDHSERRDMPAQCLPPGPPPEAISTPQ
jgi:hypothetical protein